MNAENNITVGHRTKRTFKAMTTNLIMDYKHNKVWPADDIQHYAGLLSYYRSVEKEYFDDLVKHFNQKFNVDLKSILKKVILIQF